MFTNLVGCFMSYRNKFTLEEESRMWIYVKDCLQRGETSVKGISIWQKYVDEIDSVRTATNLSSHFRKKMLSRLAEAEIAVEDIILIYNKLDIVDFNITNFKYRCEFEGKLDFFDQFNDINKKGINNDSKEKGSMKTAASATAVVTMIESIPKEALFFQSATSPVEILVVDTNNEVYKTLQKCRNRMDKNAMRRSSLVSLSGSQLSPGRNNHNKQNTEELVAELSTVSESSFSRINSEFTNVSFTQNTLEDGQGMDCNTCFSEVLPVVTLDKTILCSESDPTTGQAFNGGKYIENYMKRFTENLVEILDKRMHILLDVKILITKQIIHISRSSSSVTELENNLHEFTQDILALTNEYFTVSYLNFDDTDTVTIDFTHYVTPMKVPNTIIPNSTRDFSLKNTYEHFIHFPTLQLMKIIHRIYYIEGLAAYLAKINEKIYTSIMDEFYVEIGLPHAGMRTAL